VNQSRRAGPIPNSEKTPMSTATDATLIALGEGFEKLLLEHMDAWLIWAPRMRAARANSQGREACRPAGAADHQS
jgi:hypothetical protein